MADGEFWRGRTALVLGATGFLGGWLVRELLAQRARVVALVRRPRAQSQLHLAGFAGRVTVETGSVYDGAALEAILLRHDVDVVFHTAMAGGGVQATLAAPVDCLRSTVESTWWLLDALRRSGRPRSMIVCSSDKAYGGQQIPYREDEALLPSHPQEVAKASQDLLTQSFGKVYGLDVAVTRCGNFFGPYDFNFTRLIPYVARCCALGETPELRSDGRFSRDYLHVREAALAHLMLAEQLATRPELRGEAFNFSHEVELEVLDVLHRIGAAAGVRLAPRIRPSIAHEIPAMRLSCDKARTMLGWAPQQDFAAALADTTAWYLDWFRRSGAVQRDRTAALRLGGLHLLQTMGAAGLALA